MIHLSFSLQAQAGDFPHALMLAEVSFDVAVYLLPTPVLAAKATIVFVVFEDFFLCHNLLVLVLLNIRFMFHNTSDAENAK